MISPKHRIHLSRHNTRSRLQLQRRTHNNISWVNYRRRSGNNSCRADSGRYTLLLCGIVTRPGEEPNSQHPHTQSSSTAGPFQFTDTC